MLLECSGNQSSAKDIYGFAGEDPIIQQSSLNIPWFLRFAAEQSSNENYLWWHSMVTYAYACDVTPDWL